MMPMSRLRFEPGMTLVEVLIAMLVLSVGILAIVAGLSSGILTVQRAAKSSSAASLADDQMESIRAVSFNAIGTPDTTAADATYKASNTPYSSTWGVTLGSCASNYCQYSRAPVSAAGGTYRVDTYVRWQCLPGSTLPGSPPATPPPTCTGGTVSSRAIKQVSVVVRDNSNLKILFSETSNFDSLTG